MIGNNINYKIKKTLSFLSVDDISVELLSRETNVFSYQYRCECNIAALLEESKKVPPSSLSRILSRILSRVLLPKELEPSLTN